MGIVGSRAAAAAAAAAEVHASAAAPGCAHLVEADVRDRLPAARRTEEVAHCCDECRRFDTCMRCPECTHYYCISGACVEIVHPLAWCRFSGCPRCCRGCLVKFYKHACAATHAGVPVAAAQPVAAEPGGARDNIAPSPPPAASNDEKGSNNDDEDDEDDDDDDDDDDKVPPVPWTFNR